MGGRAVRAPAFHHCGPGSIPGSAEVIWELSLFLMLFSLHEGFSPGSPVFLPHQKSTICKIVNVGEVSVRVHLKNRYYMDEM